MPIAMVRWFICDENFKIKSIIKNPKKIFVARGVHSERLNSSNENSSQNCTNKTWWLTSARYVILTPRRPIGHLFSGFQGLASEDIPNRWKNISYSSLFSFRWKLFENKKLCKLTIIIFRFFSSNYAHYALYWIYWSYHLIFRGCWYTMVRQFVSYYYSDHFIGKMSDRALGVNFLIGRLEV